jgi:hypothetical protein
MKPYDEPTGEAWSAEDSKRAREWLESCERAHAAWLDADPRRTTAQRREAMVAKVDRKGGAR